MVDGSGLENRHARKGIGGSNPSLSASFTYKLCEVLRLTSSYLRFGALLPAYFLKRECLPPLSAACAQHKADVNKSPSLLRIQNNREK